jgi:hypothetical protein
MYGEPIGDVWFVGAVLDSAGHVVMGGSFAGTVDLGTGPLQTCQTVPFVQKMDPTP